MRSIKSTVAAGARRVFPMGSPARRYLAGSIQGIRSAQGRFTEVINLPVHQPTTRVGLETYAAWRRQKRRDAKAKSTIDDVRTSFSVIIETAGAAGQMDRTRRSVEAQQGVPVEIVGVSSGTDLAAALDRVTGDFVLFLKEGSLLSPDALAKIARAHRVDPALQLIGFDSDLIDARGRVREPLFRGAWSPEAILGVNYFGRAFAISSGLAHKAAGGPLTDTEIWAMLLRADLRSRTVGGVQEVLLSEPESSARPATVEDSVMVARVLAERGETVSTELENGVVRVHFMPETWPSVSIIVPTRHSRANLSRLFRSLRQTEYPEWDVTVIDNGGQSESNDAWYGDAEWGFSLNVLWWTETPFNYSRVNNVAARASNGEVILMLNDDTEVVDPRWLSDMVGLLMRDGVGTVGAQHRQGDGLIQHGGVMVGPGGFADNLFSGLPPHSRTIIGSTDWYRNSLAVTGACVAVRRDVFEEVGGLDERFILCGSDVVFGLDQIIRGRRNIVIPFDMIRHYESITRGTAVPLEDFYASYWRYHPWLQAGDPYVSPNVSRLSAQPVFRSRHDPDPVKLALAGLGRSFGQVKQQMTIADEAVGLLHQASVSRRHVEGVHRTHAETVGRREVRTINWFIPDIDMPFFGGLNTAFRIASKLAAEHGVVNRFVVLAHPNEEFFRSALAAAFGNLSDSEFHFYDGSDESIARIPEADASVATLWLTAMHVAKSSSAPRKFYLMQDYEPAFYPASTMFAMAEESYRLGLYAICNTESMHSIYTGMYGGKGMVFTPAVDRSLFNSIGRREKAADEPVTIFAYARDHFRNCWELAFAALSEIKRRHGDGVRIVAAGARYLPDSADFIDMGLLDFRATGDVYRETDIGLTLQISRHPSYLPLELMACGVPMVAPDSTWFSWLFKDGENSLLAMRTFDDVVERLDQLVMDAKLRRSLSEKALQTIDDRHADWNAALGDVYAYLCDPEGTGRS